MEIPLHQHHLLNPNYLQVINPPPPPPPPPEPSDRLPQWTHDETREFLAIRAQLDRTFSQTKRNKPLWEAISCSLQQRGFFRSPDQCKSKWKNLVTRFKGSETSESEPSRQQFPFYEQMKNIFAERGKAAAQMDQPEEAAEEGSRKRRRTKKSGEEEVEDALREFMRRQREMEARWVEAAEAREAERRATEEEWRASMEGLRAERAQMERRWREREEERRAREEARAERRHAVVMALLDKIAQDL